jgi:selenocysteine lyase/cysteine desulfurase
MILSYIIMSLYHQTLGTCLIDTPYGSKYFVNADFTASGIVYKPIEKYIHDHVLRFYSNVHSNAHNGQLMSHYLEDSKDLIRRSVGAKPCDKVIFSGNGCTGAIAHLIHILELKKQTEPRGKVFITVAEHHSNHLPWTHLPVDLVIIPFTSAGIIDLAFLKDELQRGKQEGRPMICSVIAGSNVTGIVQPVHAIAKLAHTHGSLVFCDFAASGPYVPINMHSYEDPDIYFDAIFLSPHKFLGGPGAPGILIAHNKLFRNEEPYCPGGGTVRFVCNDYKKYIEDPEKRETGGTPNIIGCIKAGLVFQLKDELQHYIIKRELQINQQVGAYLHTLEMYGLRLIGPASAHKCPVYSFTIKDLHYNFIVVLLNDLFGIQSRGGVSCCSLYAQNLLRIDKKHQKNIYQQIIGGHGVPNEYGWCRVSFHYSMPTYMIDYILDAIKFIVQHGHQFISLYMYSEEKNSWTHAGFKNIYPKLDFHDQLHTKDIHVSHTKLRHQLHFAYDLVE